MKMRVPAILLAVSLMPGAAAKAEGLFDLRVDVDDQSSAERDRGVREGLTTVLQRLTGREADPGDDAFTAVFDNADAYVQQYGYDDAADEGTTLRLRLDGTALEGHLRDSGIPYWAPADRPRTLAWVVVDVSGDRRVLGGGEDTELREAVTESAASAGWRVLFPLMDLRDQRALSTSQLWGNFREPIIEASERYEPEAILLGRMARRGGEWRARWTLYWDDAVHEWTVAADDQREALESGVATGVRGLATEYARVPDPDEGGELRLRVDGVDSLAAHRRVERYLERQRGVTAVVVDGVDGGGADYRLRLDATPGRALERIRDGRILREASEEADDGRPGQRPDARFRLRGG